MFCLSGIHINVDFELFAFLSFFLVVLPMLVLLLFPVPPLVATWTFTLTFLLFILFLSITLTIVFLCLLPSSLSLLFFLFFFIIIIFWVVFNVWVFLFTLFLIWWWSSSVLLILHALLLLSELVPFITYWLSRGALLASLLLLFIVNSFWAWVRFYFLSAFSFWFYILVWLLLLFVFIRDVLLSTKFRRFFFVRRCLLSLFSGCFISLLRSDLLSFLLFPSSHLFTISVLSWVLIGGDSRFHFFLLLISWRGVWLLPFFEIWVGVFICTS